MKLPKNLDLYLAGLCAVLALLIGLYLRSEPVDLKGYDWRPAAVVQTFDCTTDYECMQLYPHLWNEDNFQEPIEKE